jgi:4-carboxymuconolactone decarboxylase
LHSGGCALMSHDPAQRTARGIRNQTELLGMPAPQPTSLLDAAWRDYIFAEVWSRPALDRRSRFLIAIAGACCEGVAPEVLEGYIRGALTLDQLTQTELREAALHLSVYAGWARGTAMDTAISKVVQQLGLPQAPFAAVRDAAWDSEQRIAEGGVNFRAVMTFPSPPPTTPYFEGGILNFVFAEMWMRPGLDQRARRWLTLVGVADSAATTPIRTHIYAAMASGNATVAEMQEFVLQYAIHGGWPKASVVQAAVSEMGDRVSKGLPYQ